MELIPGLPNDIARECLIRVPYTSFSTAAAACKQWKEEIKTPAFRLLRSSNGRSQVVLVVVQVRPGPLQSPVSPKLPYSPSYRLTAFELVSGSWWELPPPPGCPDGIPMFCQLAAAGTDLVLVGGLDPVTWEASRSVYVYSFVCGEWRCGVDMPGVQRSFFACASDGQGLVFVAGGHDGEKNALRSAMAYDVAADRWLPLPDMAEERDECKGVFGRSGFLVLGGYPTETQGGFVKSAEEFDLATWQWRLARGDVIGSRKSPTTCTSSISNDRDDALFVCKDGDLLMTSASSGGMTWRVLATWHGKVMVIGSARIGDPHMGYFLDVDYSYNNNNNSDYTNDSRNRDGDRFGNSTWRQVEFEEGFSGHVQAGCLLQI